jgi:PAS domain S-box-containing protein
MTKITYGNKVASTTGGFNRRLAVGVVLVNLFVISFMAFSLSQRLDMFRERAVITTQNLTSILAQNIDNTIGKVDLGLLSAKDEIEHQIATGKPDDKALLAFMTRLQGRMPWVIGLRATNEQGWLKYGVDVPKDNNFNMSDRQFFIHHRDDPHIGLFINNPVMSHVNKVWVINFARRLNYPDGRFAGVVFANISLENFGKIFGNLNVGSHGAINLRNQEMGLLMRYPIPEDIDREIGIKDISPEYRQLIDSGQHAGTFYTPTSFDNTARIVSFSKIGAYPLFISVGVAEEDALAEWRPEVFQQSALMLLFFLMSIIGARMLAHAWTRQTRITEKLAQSENQLRAASLYARSLIEASLDPLITISPTGKITDVNQATEKVTGRGRAELIGTDFSSYFTEPEVARKGYQRVFREGFITGYPLAIRHCDGRIVDVQYNASLYRNEAGEIVGVFAAARDITNLKRSEEALRQYKDQLEEEIQHRTIDLILARDAAEAANKAKSVFLTNMSHELRTPLNAILGFSSLMGKDVQLQARHQQSLDIINRSGEHLLNLINDVLDMAKIEAGRVQLEEAPFDFDALVREVTDMMSLRANERGLQLIIDQSSECPLYLLGDESRLRQILVNLIGNAVKFTLEGGVTVRLGRRKNKVSHLLIEVEDSGPGISPEDQQRIFEPFVQLGEHGINQGGGLGLTITQQFVKLMDGNLTLESTPGKGSLFRVELPLKEATEADIINSPELEKGEVVGKVPGQLEYRILIVEDQLENQLLLSKLMEAVGLQVRIVENGQLGVQLFQSWQPHLIWMDRRMPVMDGLEAAKAIRQLPGGKEVKIVAVTASAFMEQRDEILRAGMDDFLRKPYRANEIYDCLSRQLGVQFIHKSRPEPQEQSVKLTPEMLLVLPEELRRKLKDVLENLEREQIDRIIEQVGSYDQNLKAVLACLAEKFDYPAILKALRTD